MGWYEAIKDGIAIAQKADNIPLVSELIEAQKQILDLIHENENLQKEFATLKNKVDISNKIERHKDAYIALKDEPENLIYCSNCWDSKNILIQAQIDERGKYWCPSCKYCGYYNKDKYNSFFSSISHRTVI